MTIDEIKKLRAAAKAPCDNDIEKDKCPRCQYEREAGGIIDFLLTDREQLVTELERFKAGHSPTIADDSARDRVLYDVTEIEGLVKETARLTRLLLFTHSNSCAALDADIPCDCGWVEGSAHPEDLGEVVGEIIKAVRGERSIQVSLLSPNRLPVYLQAVEDSLAAVKRVAQQHGISVPGELPRDDLGEG